MNKKHYTHDCSQCIFLGEYNNHDLYFCDQVMGNKTVIARYGNEGPDYISGLSFSYSVPELIEARKRAELQGLL